MHFRVSFLLSVNDLDVRLKPVTIMHRLSNYLFNRLFVLLKKKKETIVFKILLTVNFKLYFKFLYELNYFGFHNS